MAPSALSNVRNAYPAEPYGSRSSAMPASAAANSSSAPPEASRYFGSSADAYAIAYQDGGPQGNNGAVFSQPPPPPGGAQYALPQSAMSTDQYQASQHTHDSGAQSAAKRGSVLSFQTAQSGPSQSRSVDGLQNASDPYQNREARGSMDLRRLGSALDFAPGSSSEVDLPGAFPRNLSDTLTTSPAMNRSSLPESESVNNRKRASGGDLASLASRNRPDSRSGSAQLRTAAEQSSGNGPAGLTGEGPSSNRMFQTNDPRYGRESPTLDRNSTMKPSHSKSGSARGSLDLDTAIRSAQGTDVVEDDDTLTRPPELPDKSDVSPPPLPQKGFASPSSSRAQSPLIGRNAPRSSTPLNGAVPPLLPAGVTAQAAVEAPVGLSSPVSDFRSKPLVDVTPDMQAAGSAALNEQRGRLSMAGAGAHNAAAVSSGSPTQDRQASGSGTTTAAGNTRARSGSSIGLVPRAALVEAPSVAAAMETTGPQSVSSAETLSREPSPPPEGEIEARAEWERQQQMKRKDNKGRSSDPNASSRKTTLRGQLKPLQFVPNEGGGRMRASSGGEQSPASVTGPRASNGSASAAGAMSTQQLQRQQARDQRRSVGAINMAMAGGADLVSGGSGPYPAFASPAAGATSIRAGGRRYAGMLPQQSLVPPFELQQRPDGLLSGLIGPDGVRRSVNDPEVCLECMMRDEDMIDVNVIGQGLWERESDRDFEEALRTEQEEDAAWITSGGRNTPSKLGSAASIGDEQDGSGTGHGGSQHSSLLGTKTKGRVKRVGRHDALTSEHLKTHTQLNPPASSYRWRSLQSWLSIQAHFIILDQKARRDERDRSRRIENRSGKDRGDISETAALRPLPAISRQSSADTAPSLLGSSRQQAQGDRHSTAQLAARKVASRNRSTSDVAADPNMARPVGSGDDSMASERVTGGRPSTSTRPLETSSSGNLVAKPQQPRLSIRTDTDSQYVDEDHLIQQRRGPTTPRKSGGVGNRFGFKRGVSASELRGQPGSMASSPALPSTPDGLLPPSMLAISTPRGFGQRTASQLSLAPSGSLLEMHAAMGTSSNQAAHNLRLPMPSPMELERSASPSSARNYYGFPGDGESSPIDSLRGPPPQQQQQQQQQRQMQMQMRPSFQQERGRPTEFDVARMESENDYSTDDRGAQGKAKKKGLRGFFSKLSANNTSAGIGNNDHAPKAAVDERARRSESSPRSNQQFGRPSMSADSTLPPPPGIGGLLSKGRRSTSSLVSGRESVEQVRDSFSMDGPAMGGRDRFDMGPFQPPQPPQRMHSRLVPEESRGSPAQMPARSSSSNATGPSPGQYGAQGRSSPSPFNGQSMPSGAPNHAASPRTAAQPANANHSVGAFSPGMSPSSSRATSMMSMQSRPPPPQGQSHQQRGPSGVVPRSNSQQQLGDQDTPRSVASRQGSESRQSYADSKRSRMSSASRLDPPSRQDSYQPITAPLRRVSSSVAEDESAEGAFDPRQTGLAAPPLRPHRSPRRGDGAFSASSHSTAGALDSNRSPSGYMPQQQHLHQQQQRMMALGMPPDTNMQPLAVGPPTRDFSGGFTQELRNEFAAAGGGGGGGGGPQSSASLGSPYERDSGSVGSKGRDRKSKFMKSFGFGGGKNRDRTTSTVQRRNEPTVNERQRAANTAAAAYSPQQPQQQWQGSYYEGSVPGDREVLAEPAIFSRSDAYDTQSLRSASAMEPPAAPEGLAPPRKSMNLFERPRRMSAVLGRTEDIRQLDQQQPLRTHSALGNLPVGSLMPGKRGKR